MEMRLGLIGHPVYHSMSPTVYAKLFSKHDMCGSFCVLDIKENELCNIRKIAEKHALAAFAVTMPYKSTIIQQLDCISDDAKSANSVNLVTCKGGELIGHTTDGAGFLRVLRKTVNGELNSKQIVIYGTGGAACSLLQTLSLISSNIIVVGRSIDKAKQLAERFGVKHADIIPECDIFINATPLGMEGYPNFRSFDFLEHVHENVFDLVYKPTETELLSCAKQRSLTVENGMSMLTAQAEVALSIITE